jgi:hypothetical protein
MRTIRSVLLAAAVGVAVLAPKAASANVITETFTMTQFPAVSAAGLNLFPDSPVAEFNPADGTLTSVAESLTGTATFGAHNPEQREGEPTAASICRTLNSGDRPTCRPVW